MSSGSSLSRRAGRKLFRRSIVRAPVRPRRNAGPGIGLDRSGRTRAGIVVVLALEAGMSLENTPSSLATTSNPEQSVMIRRRWFTGIPVRSWSAAKVLALLVVLAASMAAVESRSRRQADSRLEYDDLARLAAYDPRAELPCEVTSDKPGLGFDLRFHSNYHVTVPVRALVDAGGWFQVAMRVTSTAENDQPVYLAHRFDIRNVPDEGNKEDVELSDGFDLGPGTYRVDWIMRDARARVCSTHWDLEAKTGHGKRDMPLTLAPNQVVDAGMKGSSHGPQPNEDAAQPLQVKILLNLSPAKPQESIVRPEDAAALFAILRGIAGQPGIVLSTVMAFNLREQKIVYRQEKAERIDFLALEKATLSRTSGTIDISRLRDPQSETRFVTGLLADELGAQADSPDAIVIVGAKVSLDRNIPRNSLKARGSAICPVFYLNYTANPLEAWPDTIGSALKAYKGAAVYNIVFPRDLGLAMRELLSRIGRRPIS
jgi:hypothetical protein